MKEGDKLFERYKDAIDDRGEIAAMGEACRRLNAEIKRRELAEKVIDSLTLCAVPDPSDDIIEEYQNDLRNWKKLKENEE